MKKLLSFMLALALIFSLSVPAYAANDGSITITNATIGQKYDLYKFFDASYAIDDLGNPVIGANGKAVVSYTMDSSNQFFDDMFGSDGTAVNNYFHYEKSTGVVTLKNGVADTEVIKYLDGVAANGTPITEITATSDTVVFDNIATGYYLIDRGPSSTVTITSNMPDIEIIDKNQEPGSGFEKLIWDGTNWVESNTASIGDIVEWQITFGATNYQKDKLVEYYSVRDIKSSSLWVEFEDITVSIIEDTNKDGVIDNQDTPIELTKGYYWCANSSIITNEWEYLGTGWGNLNPKPDPNTAQWYLIHYGFDEFEIVIPWLDDYTFEGVDNATKGYNLKFDLKDGTDDNDILSESIYAPTANIVLNYSGSVGPDAPDGAVKNSASLDWVTPEGTFGPEDPQVTETKVYNMGITKTANDGGAGGTATRLEGAIFELYSDEDCTIPVYVIPTNNKGVYILDDVKTVVSGTNRMIAREKYVGYWESYLGTPQNQRNDMTTPESGQLVILGLEAGKYYVKETKAPEGYNKLTLPVEVIVGQGGTTGVYDNNYTKLNSTEEVEYTVYTTTIVNNQGVELPSTGGEGTVRMITIGTMVAMAFAVLLITHKKMSIYQD